MINELYDLAKTLDNKGIAVTEWHRKYKRLPKVTAQSPCIRIWLDDKGDVYGIESLAAEHVTNLRKYGDNQSSFPAFNLSSLYRIVDPAAIAELSDMETGKVKPDIKKIKFWCNSNNWVKGAPGQVQRSLSDCPKSLIKLLGLNGKSDSNIVAKLADLCWKADGAVAEVFRNSLERCIFQALKDEEDVTIALALLFHKGSAEKPHDKDTGSKISIILDIKNWQPYGYPIASEHTTHQLNEMLLSRSVPSEDQSNSEMMDAFGTPFINPDEPMPSVKLNGFEVALRSMFDGQPCQYRYEKINDESYPIATENRSSIKKSLEWIASPEHRQVTWEKIDESEIVFIYPSKLPEVPPRFASIFGKEPGESATQTEVRFEEVAKAFMKAFRGLLPDQKPDMMEIFTIRKIDKARSKVIFTHNCTPEQLITSAESWSEGCRNLPALDVGELITPFPLETANIINAVWKQNGERADSKTPVKRMKYYQGMELLLDILPPSAIYNFLHIQISNASGLVNFLGNRSHSGGRCENASDYRRLEAQKAEAARIYTLIGLLLLKCNIRKDNYMNELSYLLGQLLHVSDELHILYCVVKRDGDIPPQLAGSALLVTAGEMPYQAVSQLAQRVNPYISWAKQYRYQSISKPGEESWRAKWLLGLFEMLSDKIMPQMDKSIRFGDFEKSKLFIGYMASLPKKEAPDQTTQDDEITGGNNNEQ